MGRTEKPFCAAGKAGLALPGREAAVYVPNNNT